MKSVFDGWTKQIINRTTDYNGGYCAGGWLIHSGLARDWSEMRDNPDAQRVGYWIQQNLDPPNTYHHTVTGSMLFPRIHAVDAIIWANNEQKLDIDGFKMADLLSRGYLPETTTNEPVGEEIHV